MCNKIMKSTNYKEGLSINVRIYGVHLKMFYTEYILLNCFSIVLRKPDFYSCFGKLSNVASGPLVMDLHVDIMIAYTFYVLEEISI